MSKYELDMELSLERLAELFRERAWLYANGSCFGVPGPEELKSQICKLARALDESKGGLAMVSGGRLAVAVDPISDGGYEVLLSIGYLNPEEGDE